MIFSVGQKVVCINDEWLDPSWVAVPNRPVAGLIYTVRGHDYWDLPDLFVNDRIFLVEITNPLVDWIECEQREGSFPTWRFRPVVERKTDISIFTQMLRTEPVKELT